ncbi:MAG: M23 family metallopeptidase [Puniceicoccales bacterium]|nr:M23 family metallopeptidase [Puniceicoccales bacterium]
MVRENGTRYHGGVDIKPVHVADDGEPLDSVFSITNGTVAYINDMDKFSNYGKYVIVVHDEFNLPVHTLYAHLNAINGNVRVGDQVAGGQLLGVMGRTANDYNIPSERAHLHFEIGLRLGNEENFQRWYGKCYGIDNPNHHGMWNGLNLVSFDPLPLLQNGFPSDMAEYVRKLPTAFVTRVHAQRIPEFLKCYPALQDGSVKEKDLCGYDVEWTWNGIPKSWRPHFSRKFSPQSPVLIYWDSQQVAAAVNFGSLTQNSKNEVFPGPRMLDVLEKILGN